MFVARSREPRRVGFAVQASLAVRYLVEILLATVAAALFYRYSRRHPARVAALGSRFEGYAARRAILFIAVAALLPLVLRLAVLPWVPPRVPRVHDEYGHLLVADTLVHGRLANPPHPLARHLETIFVLQSPTYASKYPIGQGLVAAIGTVAMGAPWAGVWLFVALMCGAITWMLFGLVPAGWAAIGGLLAAIVLGPTHGWIDTFHGGAFCAFGGALLFGALARLWKAPSSMLGLTAGLGWGIIWLTRPYESLVPLVFTWAILLARAMRARRWRAWAGTLALLGIAQLGVGGLTALHNRAVTGSFTTLPYELHQRTTECPRARAVGPLSKRQGSGLRSKPTCTGSSGGPRRIPSHDRFAMSGRSCTGPRASSSRGGCTCRRWWVSRC